MNAQLLSTRRIVSTGSAGGVLRRAALSVNAATGAPVFPPGYAITSLNSVDFGNSVRVVGGLASNGNVTLRNSAEICGPTTPGPGKTLTLNNSASVCDGFSTTPAQQDFQLQPVDLEGSTATNDDARISAAISGTGSPADVCTSCDKIEWNPSSRVLKLRNNSTLTLSGNVYNFCQLELHNSAQLIVAPRPPNTPLKIYLDTPESCGTGLGSAVFRNNSGIVNLNTDPTTLQLRVAGSATAASSVSFENSFDSTMIMAVYAPNSAVTVQNNLSLVGALAGKQVHMQNNSQLTYHERIADIATGSSIRVYQSESYVECTVAPTGSAGRLGLLIGDAFQAETMGPGRGACVRAGRPRQQCGEARGIAAPGADLEHGPDQHPDHVTHEGVGFDPEVEQRRPRGATRPAGRRARSARARSGWA